MSFHGFPCWFELMLADPEAAQDFYADLLGWEWCSAGMEGFDYRLARSGKDMVAGLMRLSDCPEGTPPSWTPYLAVEDCDASTAQLRDLGGHVWKAPADIPGTGRFAVVADPQGAVFGLLTPLPMDPPQQGGAWAQEVAGHGAWIELTTTDPRAAMAFYGTLFGWRQDNFFNLGPLGGYTVFANRGTQIGGIRSMGFARHPNWQPYFRVDGVAKAVACTKAAGGKSLRGPDELPNGTHVVSLRDPQGAHFNLISGHR